MKKKCILVFIPNTFNPIESGFIQGFYKSYSEVEAYYITHDDVQKQCKNYVGYVGRYLNISYLKKNSIFIEHGTRNININPQENQEHFITEIYYDLEALKRSDIVCNDDQYGVHIKELTEKLKITYTIRNKDKIMNKFSRVGMSLIDLLLRIFAKFNFMSQSCATFLHLNNNLKVAKLCLKNFEENGNSIMIWNIIIAKVVDFILGICLIYYCLEYKSFIVKCFRYISEDFIAHLRQLLIYLMGSPIGLKLNYAFNHSLGRFFFYHINLWRVFLQAMQPVLESYFKILLIPALLGASNQVSLFCDIISLATFHVYCIYIYAARLFSLQIRGLASLWRLFIGRKYNPLRSRVDSCEYSPNQLFIGTLGFTILLFLLPTTTMYYTVFTTFRLVILVVYTFFDKMKDILSSLPVLVVILWIFHSQKLAGTIQVNWTATTNQITLKLSKLSLVGCVEKFAIPSINSPIENRSLLRIILNLFTGRLV